MDTEAEVTVTRAEILTQDMPCRPCDKTTPHYFDIYRQEGRTWYRVWQCSECGAQILV